MIKKVEVLKERSDYLKYFFDDGSVHVLPRYIYELMQFRDVFATELEPLVAAEEGKSELLANNLNLVINFQTILDVLLSDLMEKTIKLKSANDKLYALLQKVEQTQALGLCLERDIIMEYDVINKTYFAK